MGTCRIPRAQARNEIAVRPQQTDGRTRETFCRRRRGRALTLIEAMVMMVILSFVAVAVGIGLQAVSKMPKAADDVLLMNNLIVTGMEQVKGNLNRTWPTGTFTASIMANSNTYPVSLTIGASPGSSTGYSTPTTGSSPVPLSINGQTFVLNIKIDQADPSNGSAYKTDYLQVTVTATPYISGTLVTQMRQTMVSYVSKP